jgi:hypothetical protein
VNIQLEDKQTAISFALKMARKRGQCFSVRASGEQWRIYEFQPDEFQGWHYSQLLGRDDHFVATPEKLLTSAEVQVVFEDGNCPGLFYCGKVSDQRNLEDEGGCALAVCPSLIVGNKVFSPGVEFPANISDWELADILYLNQ